MLSPLRGLVSGAVTVVTVIGLHVGGASMASAASAAVEFACASDYLSHCSKFDPDSAAGRNCMSTHGNELSKRCINALVKAGEISKAEVDRRAGRNR